MTIEVSDGVSKTLKTFTIGVSDAMENISGSAKPETLKGGIGADTIDGKSGNDTLFGYEGNDVLIGGTGADSLYGGKGADLFQFKSASDSTVSTAGRDTIFDFSIAQGDRIDLSAINANSTKGANQAFSFIELAAFSGKAGQLRYEVKSSDSYIYGDLDGDRKSDFVIHLDDAIHLKGSDFIL